MITVSRSWRVLSLAWRLRIGENLRQPFWEALLVDSRLCAVLPRARSLSCYWRLWPQVCLQNAFLFLNLQNKLGHVLARLRSVHNGHWNDSNQERVWGTCWPSQRMESKSWGQQLHCPLGSSGQCAVCSVQFNLHCTALPTDFSGQFVWAVQLWAVLGSSWAVLDLFLKGWKKGWALSFDFAL